MIRIGVELRAVNGAELSTRRAEHKTLLDYLRQIEGLLAIPFTVPTGIRLPPIHRQGPSVQPGKPSLSTCAFTAASIDGGDGYSQSKFPPYSFGISSRSTKASSDPLASDRLRICIFATISGSNHRLIHPQTMGKNDGAQTTN